MSRRAARILSRASFVLAVAMIAATGLIAFTTYTDAEPGIIVVVPAEREERIAEAAAELDPRRDCAADMTTPDLAEAPGVYCDLIDRRARGEELKPAGPLSIEALVLIAIALLWMATGGAITSRQPRNIAGWVFQLVGLSLALELFALGLVFHGVKGDPGSVPLLGFWALAGEFSLLAIALIPMLWLLFPDGRPPTPRWRWPVRLYFAGVAVAAVAALFAPGPLNNFVDIGILYMNPLAIPALSGVAGALQAIGVVTALVIAVASVAGVRGRFKRAGTEERQQLRWLRFVTTIALSGLVLMFVGGGLLEVVTEDPWGWWWSLWAGVTALAVGVGIPAAYLIAILKYGLWDLDVVIKKTVQYVVLIAALTAAAIAVVVGIPILVLGVGSGSARDLPLILAVSAVLAGLFVWIRGPAARLADRIVYGKRATPYEVLSEFSARVGETYAAGDVLPRMAAVLGEGTGADLAVIWLRVGNELRPEAVWPADAHPPERAPGDRIEVVHQGETLGALSVEMPADDPLNPTRHKLMADLASQAGLVLRNVGLLEELRASRQRLVAAQDEERRKLERNIHDGVQQQLVALNVQLGLLSNVAERDPARAASIATTLQGQATSTLEDLRDLARGIYPPLLADRGLRAALEAQARKAAVPTTVEINDVVRYAQDVEAAVYFSVLEALNNVAKYSEATEARISLAQQNGSLEFRVRDDGRGFDPAAHRDGTGLRGMADRIDAIGGSLTIQSERGGGTTVVGRVPIEDGR
jgi:signal transduction histidine kinase